jgi:bacteriocin biosynthesis cyclodehydratase domain-containing protein
MVLKLDPRIPVVWRDPSSLQFGISTPTAVILNVSAAEEQLISALSSGISESGLTMVGRAAGATDAQVASLLDRLSAALLPAPATAGVPTVLIVGSGPTADDLAIDLAVSGARVLVARDSASAADQNCDFAVIVAHYVVPPDLHGMWLRRDIPHLAVIISDTAVTIGPLIEPGVGPCLHCIQRYKSDADAAWPAIATQLLGRRPPSESPLVASEAAAIASRLVSRRLESPTGGDAVSLSVDCTSGTVTTRAWTPHPECGCIIPGGLYPAEASGEARSGTDLPDAAHHVAATRQPTTEQAASSHA